MSSDRFCSGVSERLKDNTMEWIFLLTFSTESVLEDAMRCRLGKTTFSSSLVGMVYSEWCRQRLYLLGYFWNGPEDAGADQLCRQFQSSST